MFTLSAGMDSKGILRISSVGRLFASSRFTNSENSFILSPHFTTFEYIVALIEEKVNIGVTIYCDLRLFILYMVYKSKLKREDKKPPRRARR
jgi:hypothetical protein